MFRENKSNCKHHIYAFIIIKQIIVNIKGYLYNNYFKCELCVHYDESTETLDAYVTCIRKVVALLGYGEPQV